MRCVLAYFQQLLISDKYIVVLLKILLNYGHYIQSDNATVCDFLI